MLPQLHCRFGKPSLSHKVCVYLTDAHNQGTAPKLLRVRLMLTVIVISCCVPFLLIVPCFEGASR